MSTSTRERGFVSILTVLFFMTLISVVTVSFTRFMVQERQQELEDELTKSAYNAALAGVEDAKQALQYCTSLPAADKPDCENALYTTSCPGFNTTNYFTSAIGVKQSLDGKTSVTGEAAADAAQGYGCVLVAKDTADIQGQVNAQLTTGAMYELNTVASYDTIRVYWDTSGQNTFDSTQLAAGINPRYTSWEGTAPDMLRVSIIELPISGLLTLSAINSSRHTAFLYPTSTGIPTTYAIGAVTGRRPVRCDNAAALGYRCYVDIRLASSRNSGVYLMLHGVYNSQTNFRVVALNAADLSTPVTFQAVQPSIDSTGYTSGVSRRVVARVHIGGPALTTGTAIDTGFGLCKNFKVGPLDTMFANDVLTQCN